MCKLNAKSRVKFASVNAPLQMLAFSLLTLLWSMPILMHLYRIKTFKSHSHRYLWPILKTHLHNQLK